MFEQGFEVGEGTHPVGVWKNRIPGGGNANAKALKIWQSGRWEQWRG